MDFSKNIRDSMFYIKLPNTSIKKLSLQVVATYMY